MTPDAWTLTVGALEGIGAVVVFVLGLLIGFCLLFGLTKLRQSGRTTRVVRSLDEALGERQIYLAPTTPRGPADQLRTPELLESAARKSG